MGLFDILKKKEKYAENINEDDIIECDDEILNEKDNFVTDMYAAICEKCNYGESMESLNEFERVFYIAQELEAEVNNGGFAQFFYNSSGDFSNELVDVFTKIGANKTADICRKALSVFGGEVPKEREKREEFLGNLGNKSEKTLDKCDDDFYEYEDHLCQLNYEYITKHRDFFD